MTARALPRTRRGADRVRAPETFNGRGCIAGHASSGSFTQPRAGVLLVVEDVVVVVRGPGGAAQLLLSRRRPSCMIIARAWCHRSACPQCGGAGAGPSALHKSCEPVR